MKMFGRVLLNIVLVSLTLFLVRWITNDNFQDMVISLFAITLIEICSLSDKVGDVKKMIEDLNYWGS